LESGLGCGWALGGFFSGFFSACVPGLEPKGLKYSHNEFFFSLLAF
jgi:hypothetical protein